MEPSVYVVAFVICMVLLPFAPSPLSLLIFWLAASTQTTIQNVGIFAFFLILSNAVYMYVKVAKEVER